MDETTDLDITKQELEDATAGLSDENPDKVAEYFETKKVLKTLRRDLRDFREQHEDFQELERLTKKTKEVREKIKNNQEIQLIQEKISTLKERMDLLKEIIKMELLQTEQEEIKHDGRKLRIVPTLKEMKDEENDLPQTN